MTELLQRAIAEIEKLSAEEQNVIATRLLDELPNHAISQMSFDIKASLVKKLLGYDNLPVNMAQTQIKDLNLDNIRTASREYLSEVLLAIADRFRNF
ncbi:hypothetical protein ACSQ6I_13110 [Anabaena sp. WFMT]|uniref:hypothetical protein n=1 Tax=Anabaena sp. WFMT TaxID=3449730 RepID=UPI003F27F093